MFANITHERQNTPVPIQAWSDQSTPPIYSIFYNSSYLPKENLLVGSEIHRAAVIGNISDNSGLNIELCQPVIKLTNGEEININFKEYDYTQKLELSLSNVFDYLQTEPVNIPNNADLIKFKINIATSIPDTLSNGTINTNNQTPFNGINFGLLAKDNSSNTLLSNIGSQILNNNSGIHSLTKEFTLNAEVLRGSNIHFIPNISITGSFNSNNLHFSLVNISIEGSSIAKDSTEIADNIKPTEYGLEQNYPNPFNPVTQIKYSVLEDGLVTLNVFDILGREIMTLVNEEKSAGIHIISFDASNLSSGIYFYSISSGSFNQTKKMILAK